MQNKIVDQDNIWARIEQYQLILEKDPKSVVFAPLADAYRRAGMINEALQMAARGVKLHPKHAGGRLALARIFFDQERPQDSLVHLEKAAELEPDNLLAYYLTAECYLKLKKPKEALKNFKTLLFLNPHHEKAKKAVKKLESLTADEYDDSLFNFKNLSERPEKAPRIRPEGSEPLPVKDSADLHFQLERVLSLSDAFLVRNDVERAEQVLKDGLTSLGEQPEISKRLELIKKRRMDANPKLAQQETSHLPTREEQAMDNKIQLLSELLERVRDHGKAHPRA